VPEIRATIDEQLHRKLKAEAAREGVHLKQLIAKILEDHSKNKGVGNAGRK
jgi:predicted HicB family RNase H-like nuclease